MTKYKNEFKNNVPTILIVDDTMLNVMLLSELLDDYNILTANSGKEALEIASKEFINLVLLDIMMPGMDGYEVCTHLKESEKTKDTPVIFITAKTDEDSIDKAYDVGGIDYITKPFKYKELLARVKTQLSFYTLQRDLEQKVKLIDQYVSYSTTDVDGVITEVSEAFCAISGYKKEELIGKKHSIMRHKDMDSSVYKDLWDTVKSGKEWIGEVKNRKKDGECFWVSVVITPRYDERGNIFGFTAIRNDITNQKRVEKLSITDQLTNLYNRRYFNETFPKEIKRAMRRKHILSFVMLDVDFFKQYNDTYGHQSGDEVLSRIGTTLKDLFHRGDDFVFRLGGEEFGVIYTCENYECSQDMANRIQDAITALDLEHSGSSVSENISVSIGVANIDFSKEENYKITQDMFYRLADSELYKAKHEGRDRICSIDI